MCLPRKPAGRTQNNGLTVPANNYRRPGSALIELMLAITVLLIVLLGTSTTYVTGRRQIVGQRYYQAAAQLASQKLEDVKALGYAGLAEGEQDEDFSIYGLDYQRHTVIQLTAEPTVEIPRPCYKVTVTIRWTGTAQDNHQSSFATYIGP